MVGTQRFVAETPPAFSQSERHVDPHHRHRPFQQQQHRTGRGQLTHMRQRTPQIRSRVQDVRCDDQVERLHRDPLCQRICLDVEQSELDMRMRSEALACAIEEQRRQIGEQIRRSSRQHIEDVAGGTTGSGTDLENAQWGTIPRLNLGAYHIAQCAVVRARE